MNSIGIKGNRKPTLLGSKIAHAAKLIGQKAVSRLETAVSQGNANIENMDSNVIDSQKMPTGLDRDNSKKSSKNGLERGNKQKND
jgi:hypothetical protein